jgi:hypothetical protein
MEVSGQLHAPVALPPGKQPSVTIVQEAGLAPETFLILWRIEKNLLPLPGIEPRHLSRPARSPVPIPTVLSLKSSVIYIHGKEIVF